jgi:hypothetical protein
LCRPEVLALAKVTNCLDVEGLLEVCLAFADALQGSDRRLEDLGERPVLPLLVQEGTKVRLHWHSGPPRVRDDGSPGHGMTHFSPASRRGSPAGSPPTSRRGPASTSPRCRAPRCLGNFGTVDGTARRSTSGAARRKRTRTDDRPARHTPCLSATQTGWRSLRHRAGRPSILASPSRRVDDQAGPWRARLRYRARPEAAERGRWRRRGAAGHRGQHRCCWSVGGRRGRDPLVRQR